MKLSEQQMASLSSPKAVKEFMESQKENITSIIKQNIAVGDIFKRENLQVDSCFCILFTQLFCSFPCAVTSVYAFVSTTFKKSSEGIKKVGSQKISPFLYFSF